MAVKDPRLWLAAIGVALVAAGVAVMIPAATGPAVATYGLMVLLVALFLL